MNARFKIRPPPTPPPPPRSLLDDATDLLQQKARADINTDEMEVSLQNLYVDLHSGASVRWADERINLEPLMDRVDAFLHDRNTTTLLLQGNAGSGKSLFGRHLEARLWTKYNEG